MRKESLQQITQGGSSVALSGLRARGDIKGLLLVKRSYGPIIDAMTDTPGLERISTTDNQNLLRMLDGKRMDYTIEYPYVLEYMRRQSTFRNELVTVPLAETSKPLVGYVACTRNAWGAAVMADIDKAIRGAARDEAYREAAVHWLPVEQQTLYKTKFDEFFNQLATSPAFKAD